VIELKELVLVVQVVLVVLMIQMVIMTMIRIKKKIKNLKLKLKIKLKIIKLITQIQEVIQLTMTQIIKLVNNIIFINKKIFKKIRKYFFIIVTNITNLFNKLFHTYKYNNDDLSKSFAFTILFN
jgi:hypothetical protein